MAGDWIKVQYSTPEKPEMLAVSTKLGLDPDAVFAAWFRIWKWADANLSRNGHARNVTMSQLDRVAGVTGIAQAFADEGWIQGGNEGLVFVNFDRHNGKSAKERALAADRKREERDEVPKMSRSQRDKNVTREEKRREEKKKSNKSVAARFADEVYRLYPRKVQRPLAMTAIAKALNNLGPEAPHAE